MLSLMGEELARRVEYVAALGSDAVDVVANFGEATLLERAGLVLHEFFESIPRQLLVFDVI